MEQTFSVLGISGTTLPHEDLQAFLIPADSPDSPMTHYNPLPLPMDPQQGMTVKPLSSATTTSISEAPLNPNGSGA